MMKSRFNKQAVLDALALVHDFADEYFISDTCRPDENREIGCISCDLLRVLEAMEVCANEEL